MYTQDPNDKKIQEGMKSETREVLNKLGYDKIFESHYGPITKLEAKHDLTVTLYGEPWEKNEGSGTWFDGIWGSLHIGDTDALTKIHAFYLNRMNILLSKKGIDPIKEEELCKVDQSKLNTIAKAYGAKTATLDKVLLDQKGGSSGYSIFAIAIDDPTQMENYLTRITKAYTALEKILTAEEKKGETQ